MANKRNNPQAGKAKEKAGWSWQWLVTSVRQWLFQHLDSLIFIFIITFSAFLIFGSVPEWVSGLLGEDGRRGGIFKWGILIFIGISSLVLWEWLTQHRINWLIFIFIIIFLITLVFDSVPERVSGLLGDDGDDGEGGGTLKRGILTFIGIGIGGLVFWKRVISVEQQAEAMAEQARAMVEQARAMAEQAKAMVAETEQTKAGHTQERLKTSIDHLGSTEKSVRIGAAYELYHLAKDREEYRETVCDILCGHIRQKTQEEDYKKQQKNKPSEEIKTFLRLLKAFLGLLREEEKDPSKCQVDLSSSFLRGANLSGAHLQGADLQQAQLHGANLSSAELQGADLSRAQLEGVDLSKAQLAGANLSWAQLAGANLSWAQLAGANLSWDELQGANLSWAQLQGASLSGAQLQGADLSWAHLHRADLSGAQLQGADLSWAHLQGANLSEAKLQGVSSSEEHSKLSFQERILDRAGKESDFTNVVFSGGLDAGKVKEIIASMPAGMEDEIKKEMKKRLNEHVDKEVSNKLPDNSGAITGAYNKDKAEEWIADYEKSTSHQPAKDK